MLIFKTANSSDLPKLKIMYINSISIKKYASSFKMSFQINLLLDFALELRSDLKLFAK